jgi:pimeloyl-ACP methyl ester carboxylesterase
MPYYQSYGLKLHFHEHGKGEPLILLHGFAQDSSAWADPLPIYSQFFRVLVMDMRGAGLSEVPDPGYTPADLADDAIALMNHLDLPKAHFGGFSLGGAAGLELGIRYSDRLISLSLHSTWPGGPCPSLRRWVDVRSRIIAAGDQTVNIGTRIVSFFSPEFADAHEDRIEEFVRRAASNPHPTTPKGAAGHAQACWHHDVRGRLNEITVPTLITCGTLDRATLPSHSRYLHEHIPRSELIFIDEGGHFTPFQSPGEFVSISLGFLIKHTEGRHD